MEIHSIKTTHLRLGKIRCDFSAETIIKGLQDELHNSHSSAAKVAEQFEVSQRTTSTTGNPASRVFS